MTDEDKVSSGTPKLPEPLIVSRSYYNRWARKPVTGVRKPLPGYLGFTRMLTSNCLAAKRPFSGTSNFPLSSLEGSSARTSTPKPPVTKPAPLHLPEISIDTPMITEREKGQSENNGCMPESRPKENGKDFSPNAYFLCVPIVDANDKELTKYTTIIPTFTRENTCNNISSSDSETSKSIITYKTETRLSKVDDKPTKSFGKETSYDKTESSSCVDFQCSSSSFGSDISDWPSGIVSPDSCNVSAISFNPRIDTTELYTTSLSQWHIKNSISLESDMELHYDRKTNCSEYQESHRNGKRENTSSNQNTHTSIPSRSAKSRTKEANELSVVPVAKRRKSVMPESEAIDMNTSDRSILSVHPDMKIQTPSLPPRMKSPYLTTPAKVQKSLSVVDKNFKTLVNQFHQRARTYNVLRRSVPSTSSTGFRGARISSAVPGHKLSLNANECNVDTTKTDQLSSTVQEPDNLQQEFVNLAASLQLHQRFSYKSFGQTS